ncbi:hypothetical protein [Methylocucumis oryzae]|uniref:Uncharacterized protein n=1 Tax=Methylocucumis oryzae TaxID=1632867 RepID=A0A0F3IMD0_9GAMM|nr:hypothetical protein [Methylocucumis oryzae]KJV07673.1 hypothetical protein VZ94_03150 [Methylocucumis oryzae]
MVQKIDNKFDLITQDQTRFIERQTALINNNAQQIDQLQRIFDIQRGEIAQVKQDILNAARPSFPWLRKDSNRRPSD